MDITKVFAALISLTTIAWPAAAQEPPTPPAPAVEPAPPVPPDVATRARERAEAAVRAAAKARISDKVLGDITITLPDLIIPDLDRSLIDLESRLQDVPPPTPPVPAGPLIIGRGRGEGPLVFRNQAEALYDQGRDFIERGQYEQAVQKFDRVIEMKAKTADAAFYWKAYSLGKLGDRPKALTTLDDMQKQFTDSRWI